MGWWASGAFVCDYVPAKRGDRRTGLKRGDMRAIDVAMDANKFESMMRESVILAIRQKVKLALATCDA
eukprot:scaffold125247_cov40-Tisochrysis_lutea.AAC.1